MRVTNLILSGILLFSGSVFAADENTAAPNKYQARLDFVTSFAGQPKNSIPYVRNYSFEPLGNNALLMKDSGNNAYLLSLENGCNNLTNAKSINVNYRGSTINTKFDSVRVISRKNNMSEKCQISLIQPIDLKAMQAAEATIRESIKNSKKSG